MHTSYATLRDQAAQLLATASSTGNRVILGITGAPGAGKSTLAAQLVADLASDPNNRVALVPMDGFHLANRVLLEHGSRHRKGAIDTFDGAGFANLLARLRTRDEQCVYAPEFRRDLEESVGSALPIAREVDLVITEGNYLLAQAPEWLAARALLDEVWFLNPPAALRQSRLIARHIAGGKTPEAAESWSLGTDETNARFINDLQPFADLVVTLDDEGTQP